MLKKTTNVHKLREFLIEYCLPILQMALPEDRGRAEEESDDLLMFMNTFMDTVMPGLLAFQVGVRENNASMWRSGRKALLPLLYTNNHSRWAPLLLDDIAVVDHRCTAPVRRLRELFLSCRGQGFGWIQEEANKKAKRACIANNDRGWRLATSALSTMDTMRERVEDWFGLKTNRRNDMLRAQSQDRDSVVEVEWGACLICEIL